MIVTFPHHTLRGSHREVGRQHGEALRSLIRAHLELIYTQGVRKSQRAPETARRWALAFGAIIGDAAPHFLDEIEGVAEGAGRMEVAVGPPGEHEYATDTLEAGR
jgi:isopenicillin-N N-acyltransferase-like protein